MLSKFFYKKDECSKEYKIGEELGSGSFAIVRRATNREDRSEWAVKIIDKTKLDAEDAAALEVEVAILQKVHHPHIVQLRQIFDCPKHVYMVMELMTGGELFDRIVEKEKYTEEEARVTVQKIAGAIEYCHNMGIVHRDLKPENLLYSDPTDDASIKIADFGLAKILKEDDMMATQCGTPGYVAPEILEGHPYTDKVDIWSLGVITYILLCGFPPFYDENNQALFAQIKAGAYDFPSPYWDGVSAEAKEFIRKLLVVDPKKRLSARELLEHSWLATAAGKGATNDISSNLANMKRFNARRKLRAGIRLAKAVQAFQKMGKAGAMTKLLAGANAASAALKASEEGAGGGSS
jgi:calcium/calmodulin-dependent protein kinase I